MEIRDLYQGLDLFNISLEEEPDSLQSTVDSKPLEKEETSEIEPLPEVEIDDYERNCLVEKEDPVVITAAVDQSVESIAYFEQYKGKQGRVVSFKKISNPSKKRLYNVKVIIDKTGETTIFYDTELSIKKY